MRKIIKWILRIILTLLLILVLGIVSIPLFFKEQIKAEVLKEIDRSIDADAYFSELSFSSLRNFPQLTISLQDVSLIGREDFKGDTLARAKELSVSLNIQSILKGNKFEINSIRLEDPLIYARILANGKANYNIVNTSSPSKTVSPGKFDINIRDWEIVNGRLIYDDQVQKTYVEVGGLFHKGSGDFKSDVSDLDITTKVKDLTLRYNGVPYFDKKLFKADLNMEMNFKEKKFTFKDHSFQLGHFRFGFDGYFKLLDSGYETDIRIVVKETSFRNLLSLLPGIYQKDMEGISTKGEFSCKGFIRGVYDALHQKVPSYHFELKVEDAQFKYAHLPKAVDKINFDLVADNSKGDPEQATLDLKRFYFEIDREPIYGNLFIKGLKDLHIRADIKLKADLAQLEKIYPIDSLTLKGSLNSEIKINGRYNPSLKLFPKVDAFIVFEKGYVKQTGSPLEMDSIYLKAELINGTGQLADTRINLSHATFLLDGQPFLLSGTIDDLKDYNYHLKVDGLVDLAKLTSIYPIPDSQLKGSLDFDIEAQGNLPNVEAKRYDLLKTEGTLEVKNLSYKTAGMLPLHVDDALLTFDDDKIILSRFKAELGKSNVSLSGHLYNYIPYLIRSDAPIKADLTLSCDTLDMNEWFPASAPADSSHAAPVAASAKEPLLIPASVDLTFDSDIRFVRFGQMNIENLDGEIRVKEGVCTLNETGFNTLDSKFVLRGDYDTRDPKHPLFDLNIEVDKLDFNKAYKAFVDPKGVSPAEGNFSTSYSLKGELNPDFSPINSTLSGNGKIIIDSVKVKGLKIMNHLKNVSKKEAFNNPSLNDVTIDTQIRDGKLFLSPFTFKVDKFLTEVEGWQGFDEKMEYLIRLSVPLFNRVKIPVSISGTADKPLIKMGKGFSKGDLEGL